MTELLQPGFADSAVDYRDGLALQRRIHGGVVAGGENTLILLEHRSVYTAGKRTEDAERPTDGTPVIDVDRGGKITWHGPGQLVGYPILRLPDPIDVVAYVRLLEGMLVEIIRGFGIDCGRVEGRSGVWITGAGADLKIAAIGIRVASGVTSHGFALNCSNSLEPYSRIIACGIRDAGVTTISEQLGREVTPVEIAPLVAAHFDAVIADLGLPVVGRSSGDNSAAGDGGRSGDGGGNDRKRGSGLGLVAGSNRDAPGILTPDVAPIRKVVAA